MGVSGNAVTIQNEPGSVNHGASCDMSLTQVIYPKLNIVGPDILKANGAITDMKVG